jgi:hypothetical protein
MAGKVDLSPHQGFVVRSISFFVIENGAEPENFGELWAGSSE